MQGCTLSLMSERKQINFTIVPDDASPVPTRQYANFAAVAHTPFDFTITFCEVMPLSEREIRYAETNHDGACARKSAPRHAGAVHSNADRRPPGKPAHLLRVATHHRELKGPVH